MSYDRYSVTDGKHALFSPSQSSWDNWDYGNLDILKKSILSKIKSQQAADVGTLVHEYAADRIKYHLPLNKYEKKSLILHLKKNGICIKAVNVDFIFSNLVNYVNDSIRFGLFPEQEIRYSDYCFGTADAVGFDGSSLLIFDLKTGTSPAHMRQLIYYATYYCLVYNHDPMDISTELRIYQNNKVECYNPTPEELYEKINKTKILSALSKEIFEED